MLNCGEKIKRINERLERYQTVPIVWTASSPEGGFIIEDVPASRDQSEYDECEAARQLLELSKMNLLLLNSLRQCEYEKCQKWFFARFSHNRFCRERDCQNEYNKFQSEPGETGEKPPCDTTGTNILPEDSENTGVLHGDNSAKSF